MVVEVILFRPSPVHFFQWRNLLLVLHGAAVGKGCKIYPSARIWAPWHLVADTESVIGPRCNVYSMAPITLGRKAVVSQDVDLVAGSHDYARIDLQPLLPLIVKPIVVGNYCWICARSFLLPGVVIGEGSVIGACSVVTRDQPPWMVCAGSPCRPLKPRTQPSYAQV